MNLIPEDIYTSHPEISKHLMSVSKHLSSIALKGACNSLINKDEIIKYIDSNNYSKIGIMCIYNSNESVMDIFIKKQCLDWERHATRITEIPNFNIISVNNIKNNNIYPLNIRHHIMENPIKTQLITIYVDVTSAFKIFFNRVSCKELHNYAKQLTKDYFNFIIKNLNTIPLYFYLIGHKIILGEMFIFTPKNKDENIETYIERINEKVESLIIDMNDYIDKIY